MAKSKLTPKLKKQIVELLEMGATDQDAFMAVGISKETFYRWLREGQEQEAGKQHDFYDAVTRARSKARLDAIETLKAALDTQYLTDTHIETVTETRVNAYGTPYEYSKTRTKEFKKEQPADWRAAVEYLKRRDKEHWSERQEVTGADGSEVVFKVVYDDSDS